MQIIIKQYNQYVFSNSINNKFFCSKSCIYKGDNVYKLTLILQKLFKRFKNMAQKKQARHLTNCKLVSATALISADASTSSVPLSKRKEDAKQILYLNRV